MTPSTTAATELEGIALGDKRLNRRAVAIACRAAETPALSFPHLMPTSGELEGAYRFFQNDSVDPERLLAPHVAAASNRVRAHDVVRIAHDTVALSYGGEREGLGALGGGGCGFYAHVALAISPGEERAVLGVLGTETKVYPTLEEKEREFQARKKQWEESGRPCHFPRRPVYWSVAEKWSVLPLRLKSMVSGVGAIHLMDQEADDTELMAALLANEVRFVIRGSATRRIAPEAGAEEYGFVEERLRQTEFVLSRKVRLEGRPKPVPNRMPREERDAKLSVRAASVRLAPTKREYATTGTTLAMNVVQVVEIDAPAGEESIDWVLFTTEPIDTPDDVAAVVDHYRARWRIEELFKALKTGCSIEKRQLMTYDALRRALALFLPIAWQLLALRSYAQAETVEPASKVLSPLQLTVLSELVAERKIRLSEEPTAHEALLAIAALGGHLKRNGPPGWITLARGYNELGRATIVWQLAIDRCDQS